jgi:hypothetical protein
LENSLPAGIRQFVAATIFCAATIALAQPEQPESPIDAAVRNLTANEIGTRERALYALLAESGIKVPNPVPVPTRVRVNTLLRTHPEQAERIKAALIAATERVGTEYQAAAREGLVQEDLAEYQTSLVPVVEALREPRAVKALLVAGGVEGLAEICPSAVDSIIRQVHGFDPLDAQGNPIGSRQWALKALGACLMRPAMMRAHPSVLAKIRRELLADLDDPDCTLRGSAMVALFSLRADPEVRAKLEIMATSGPTAADYSRASKANKPDLHCILRYTASGILSSDEYSFFVTRTPGTRVCRVQPASEARVEEQFLGPDLVAVVKPWMCGHYDPTGQDPSLCWKLEPSKICSTYGYGN